MVSCIHPCYKKLFEKRSQLVIILLVGLIALTPALTLLDAQFRGEDEVLMLRVAVYLAQTFQNAAFKAFVKRLITDYYPPARNIIVLPFVLILGANEVALRLPNVFLWVAVCMSAANVGLSEMIFLSGSESTCLHLPGDIRQERKIRAVVSYTDQNFCAKDTEKVLHLIRDRICK